MAFQVWDRHLVQDTRFNKEKAYLHLKSRGGDLKSLGRISLPGEATDLPCLAFNANATA